MTVNTIRNNVWFIVYDHGDGLPVLPWAAVREDHSLNEDFECIYAHMGPLKMAFIESLYLFASLHLRCIGHNFWKD